jgi:hypothetical protein
VTPTTLERENCEYEKTGGVSCNNIENGFISAFMDAATGQVFRSCFGDGRPAPVHVLDGLPDELITARSGDGRVVSVKKTVVAGFTRAEIFFTREQVALLLAKK